MPVVAMAAFGGDQQALNDAVFGNPGDPDPRAHPIGNLDRLAADATRRSGGPPTFMSIENFGRADSTITVFNNPKSGNLAPQTLLYRGATAEFEREKPSIGTVPSAGGTLAAIMGPIHFGNFAGLLSKGVWFGLGFAMCYVTYTGLRLWLVRRREASPSLAWLERAVTVVGMGLPFALVGAAAAFLFAKPMGVAVLWTPAAFLAASAIAIIAGFLARSNDALDDRLQLATGVLLLALPAIRLVTGGPGWVPTIAQGQPIIVALDLAMMLGGGWMLWRKRGRRLRFSPGSSVMQPAE